jgi:hypothetical protein
MQKAPDNAWMRGLVQEVHDRAWMYIPDEIVSLARLDVIEGLPAFVVVVDRHYFFGLAFKLVVL